MTGLLQIACKSLIMLNYHPQILPELIAGLQTETKNLRVIFSAVLYKYTHYDLKIRLVWSSHLLTL